MNSSTPRPEEEAKNLHLKGLAAGDWVEEPWASPFAQRNGSIPGKCKFSGRLGASCSKVAEGFQLNLLAPLSAPVATL